MASISLMKIAEKMKLENLTPEINLKGIKVTLPDINRPALPMAGYPSAGDWIRRILLC